MQANQLLVTAFLISLLVTIQAVNGQSNSPSNETPKKQLRSRKSNLQESNTLPCPFHDLTRSQIKNVNKLLRNWEANSKKTKCYQCSFSTWTYNSEIVPMKDPLSKHVYAQSISTGVIKLAAPDKAMFESNKIWTFDRQRFAARKTPFEESPTLKERWYCDGTAVYEYIYNRKELVVTQIPKELQGGKIVHEPILNHPVRSRPLPFLFFANSEELQKRYWIRAIKPEKGNDSEKHWFEAFPKDRQDAASVQKMEFAIDEKDFVLVMMTLYFPEHDLETGQVISKQTVRFDDQEKWEDLSTSGASMIFEELDKRPETPFGWKRTDSNIRDVTKS